MIYNQLSEYLLKHLAQVQTLMMMSASSEDAGFRSITRKFHIYFSRWLIDLKLFAKMAIDCVFVFFNHQFFAVVVYFV